MEVTHSPILLTLPDATIFGIQDGEIRATTYQETDHYRVTRDFLNAPDRFSRHLLDDTAAFGSLANNLGVGEI